MIIIDKALEKLEREGKPITVGLIGAGFMGRAIALQLLKSVPGIRLVGISNRHIEAARKAYMEAGCDDFEEVSTVPALEDRVRLGKFSVMEDGLLLCQAAGIDVVVEVTGNIPFGAEVTLEAIRHHKHVVSMNAELDGTIGPLLKVLADREGVIFTNSDGDQPGVILNLYRFVKGIGLRPVLCGNNKGLQDPYRNPTTQQEFATKWGQKPHMVASFADGTKISYEQAIVANATGMRVARRGMYGFELPPGTRMEDLTTGWYPEDVLLEGPGIVDYVVGADPAPGVFVFGVTDHPIHQHYLNLYKLGQGPIYCFYRPYHLCHFEVHNSIARAVLFQDATIVAKGAPMVEVVTTAKRDLQAGEIIDPIGYYMTYGQCENSDIARKDNLLPIGLAEGCVLLRDVKRDEVLSYDDIQLPAGRLIDRLFEEQKVYFGTGETINSA